MKVRTRIYFIAGVTALAVAACLLFVWPHLMVAREQSQLFLWNCDYLGERLMVPGGLAQYVGEWLVQFFYHPLFAAGIYAILCFASQLLVFRLVGQRYWFLSFTAPVVVGMLATQPYVPMTLTVALVLTLLMMVLLPPKGMPHILAMSLLTTVGYWFIGPAAVFMLLCCRWRQAPFWAVLLAGAIYISSLVTPYPLRQVARGIDYYWEMHHLGTSEEQSCDWLMRQQRWADIAEGFKDSKSTAIQNAVFVARFHLRQISEQQLNHQIRLSKGAMHSESGAFLMSEVCMQIGMAQMAQRAAFEAMEAIPNHNKSGRALRRLVETNLVTGYPQVAMKYIGILEETFAYSSFSKRMRQLATHPEQLNNHPYYGPLQKAFTESHDTFF